MSIAQSADRVADVVLIHGLNCTSRTWTDVTAALPDSIRALAIDCPALADVDLIAESVVAGLPARFHAVGYSFGGYVALALLDLFPERVESVVLIATNTFGDTDAQRQFRAGAINAAVERGHDALSLEQFTACVHPVNRTNQHAFDRYWAEVRAAGAARYVAHQRACMRRPDRTGVLRRAAKPVLLITPEVDNVIPVRRQLRSVADVPWAVTTSVPNTGHLLPLEEPSAVARIITQWVLSDARSSADQAAKFRS